MSASQSLAPRPTATLETFHHILGSCRTLLRRGSAHSGTADSCPQNPEQAREIVQQALNELRRALETGDIAPGPYREINTRFEHRMQRLERKSKRPLWDGLATPVQA